MGAHLQSEIRGVFIHTWENRVTDWNQIVQTCIDGGANLIILELYPYHLTSGHNANIDAFTQACRIRGVECHVLLCTMLGTALPPESGKDWLAETTGGKINWLCATKSDARTLIRGIAEDLASNYDVDGLMLDYIRWENINICYCQQCKAKFIADTGLIDVNWVTDVISSGRYYRQWLNWRITPITELIRDVRGWTRSIKYSMLLSASVFYLWTEAGTPIGYFSVVNMGQHPADWVEKGYLDFIVPMSYTTNLVGDSGYPGSITNHTQTSQLFFIGARTNVNYNVPSLPINIGAIPMPVFIMNDPGGGDGTPTPAMFAQEVDTLRANGAHGWIIWRYGGPGLASSYDITPFLTAISKPSMFQIQNITVSIIGTIATISWTTTTPASSRVEFSDNPLFIGTKKLSPQNVEYVDVDYIGGTTIEDVTLKTNHQLTFPVSASGTYYRIISINADGTVASGVFSTVEGGGGITTPYRQQHPQGNYQIIMPTQISSGTTVYNFTNWDDLPPADPDFNNPNRIITLNADKIMIAHYDAVVTSIIPSAGGPYNTLPTTPTIQFVGSATGGTPPYSWLWDFGDGQTSTEQNPIYTYPTIEAIYNVTLTVTDSIGATAIATTITTISSIPSGPCFIATVAFDSPLAPQLNVFRRFRDHYLPYSIVHVYYRVGKYLARWIGNKRAIKRYTREVLNILAELLE